MSDINSTHPLPLAGRHAMVGGSTQGIGRACAEALAAAGASVTLLGRNPEGLAVVQAVAHSHKGTVRYIPGKAGACFEMRLPLQQVTQE